jgi:hypothetical protein
MATICVEVGVRVEVEVEQQRRPARNTVGVARRNMTLECSYTQLLCQARCGEEMRCDVPGMRCTHYYSAVTVQHRGAILAAAKFEIRKIHTSHLSGNFCAK